MDPAKGHSWASPSIVLLIAGACLAVGGAAVSPQRGPLPFLVVAAVIGLVGLAYLLCGYPDPAWTLTASIYALSVLGGNWQQLGLPRRICIPPDRLLLGAGIAALLLRAPGARNREDIRVQPIHLLMAATILYAAASAFSAGTLFSNAGFFRLLDRFGVAPFSMFLLAPIAFNDERRRKIFLGALVILGGYLGLTALFETVGPSAFVFPKFILNPALGIHADRARGPFLEAEANGIALYSCALAAMVAFVTWRQQPWVRCAAVAVALLCVLGCLFTLSRGVWLAAVAATIVTMLGFRGLRRFVIPAAGTIAALVIAAFLLVPGFAGKADQRASDRESLWDRTNLSSAAVNMVEMRDLVWLWLGPLPGIWRPCRAEGGHPSDRRRAG